MSSRSAGKNQLFYDYWHGLAFLEMIRQMVEVKVTAKQRFLSSVSAFHGGKFEKIDF